MQMNKFSKLRAPLTREDRKGIRAEINRKISSGYSYYSESEWHDILIMLLDTIDADDRAYERVCKFASEEIKRASMSAHNNVESTKELIREARSNDDLSDSWDYMLHFQLVFEELERDRDRWKKKADVTRECEHRDSGNLVCSQYFKDSQNMLLANAAVYPFIMRDKEIAND